MFFLFPRSNENLHYKIAEMKIFGLRDPKKFCFCSKKTYIFGVLCLKDLLYFLNKSIDIDYRL